MSTVEPSKFQISSPPFRRIELTTTVVLGNCCPKETIAKPLPASARLDANVQLVSIGLLLRLYTPPPSEAVLPANVQLVSTGLPKKPYTPPPSEAVLPANVQLIIDEVVSGMGRLGTLWGCERAGILPDMIVAGKGFSGGMFPVAALVVRPEVIDFWGNDPYKSISSYAWSNVGAVVSRVAIEETPRVAGLRGPSELDAQRHDALEHGCLGHAAVEVPCEQQGEQQ